MLETVFFVYGFQEEWLQCHRIDQGRSIRDDKKKLEQAKKRLSNLDVIISRLYEDYILGNLSQDRYKKMAADYEAEQERLKLEIEVIEEWVEQREKMNDGLDAFIALTQKYVDVEELTQTIVNEYIKKIIVYAPDKSSGKRKQKVKIFFNFVDDIGRNSGSQGAGIYFAVHQATAVGTGLFGDFIPINARRSQSIFQCLFTSNRCHIENRPPFFHLLCMIRQSNAIFPAKLQVPA